MNDAPEVVISHAHPTHRLDNGLLEHLVHYVLRAEGCTLQYLGLILADHETVLALNRTYLSHDYVTDVLSFPLGDGDAAGVVDGEIYVDLDTAAERHAEFEVSFDQEVFRYVIHGLLHLIGYDDATPAQREVMQRLEETYLAEIL